MILVLLGGGCLRDLDHPHPEPVQVVVDALQKLQHLCPFFLPMFVCTNFVLANISLCISFRICLSAPLFCQILSFNAFFVSNCLSASGLFEKSVLTGVVLLHKRPFQPTIPASMYSMIKWNNAFLALQFIHWKLARVRGDLACQKETQRSSWYVYFRRSSFSKVTKLFHGVPADSFYENLLADTKLRIWKLCWFFFVKLFGRSSLQAQQSLTMTGQFKARGQLYNIHVNISSKYITGPSFR